jgi:hypothetical protein
MRRLSKMEIIINEAGASVKGRRQEVMAGITFLLRDMYEDGKFDKEDIEYICKLATASEKELKKMTLEKMKEAKELLNGDKDKKISDLMDQITEMMYGEEEE